MGTGPRSGRSRSGRLRVVVAAVSVAGLATGCVVGATGDASVVGDTSVRLTGTLLGTQDVEQPEYWFEYGPTAQYGSRTDRTTVFVGRNAAPVSATVEGLRPGSVSHYRLCSDVATDSLPRHCGADRTVATSVGRVSVTGTVSIFRPDVFPLDFTAQRTFTAAADPGGTGYLDGVAQRVDTYLVHGTVVQVLGNPATYPYVVDCVRALGNLAVLGFSWHEVEGQPLQIVPKHELLVVEDHGATGDRYAIHSFDPQAGCPAPAVGLLDPVGTGAVDVTISGG
jgi:hypothetical protein